MNNLEMFIETDLAIDIKTIINMFNYRHLESLTEWCINM